LFTDTFRLFMCGKKPLSAVADANIFDKKTIKYISLSNEHVWTVPLLLFVGRWKEVMQFGNVLGRAAITQ